MDSIMSIAASVGQVTSGGPSNLKIYIYIYIYIYKKNPYLTVLVCS
jgi:hypothetical protein